MLVDSGQKCFGDFDGICPASFNLAPDPGRTHGFKLHSISPKINRLQISGRDKSIQRQLKPDKGRAQWRIMILPERLS